MFKVNKKALIALIALTLWIPQAFSMKKIKDAFNTITTTLKNQKIKQAIQNIQEAVKNDDEDIFNKNLQKLQNKLPTTGYDQEFLAILDCALVNNKLDFADAIYALYPLDLTIKNKDGETLLNSTIFHTDSFDENNEDMGGNIRWVISKNPNMVPNMINLKNNNYGVSPLALAATKDTANLFKYLIAHGAKIIISNPHEQEMFEYLKRHQISNKTIKKLLYYYYLIEDADKFNCNDFFDCNILYKNN